MKVGDYVRTKYGEICKLKKSKYKYLLYETDIEIDRYVDRDCNDFGFDSAKDVETKLNINHSHISDCCRGKRNKTGGYSWRFVNE